VIAHAVCAEDILQHHTYGLEGRAVAALIASSLEAKSSEHDEFGCISNLELELLEQVDALHSQIMWRCSLSMIRIV